jgi:hypothetical protein
LLSLVEQGNSRLLEHAVEEEDCSGSTVVNPRGSVHSGCHQMKECPKTQKQDISRTSFSSLEDCKNSN